MINTHGLDMVNLESAEKEASYLTDDLVRRGCHVEIAYNTDDGHVITEFFVDNGWYCEYRNQAIVPIGNLRHPASAQEIADMIAEVLQSND